MEMVAKYMARRDFNGLFNKSRLGDIFRVLVALPFFSIFKNS
jgi:hypothetical protein